MKLPTYLRPGLLALQIVAVGTVLSLTPRGFAQTAAPPAAQQGPFTLLSPETLSLTLFGGGYISADFGATEEGFQLEQSITSSIGVVARATGYQLYIEDGFDNPLNPGTGHHSRFNFARLQAGIDLKPLEGTHLSILGGGDVADSDAATVEGDVSAWLLRHSQHPVNVAVSSIYGTQNQVVSNEVDVRAVAYSTESYTLLAGGGGAIYAGGFVHGVAGQGGVIFGVFLPHWQAGIDVQSGYGSAQEYGEIAIYKQFAWTE